MTSIDIQIILSFSMLMLNHSKGASIANTTITNPRDQTTTIILHEFERSDSFATTRFPHLLNRSHDHANWMSPTDRIPRLLQFLQPSLMTPTFTSTHTFEIYGFDRFVNCWFSILGRRSQICCLACRWVFVECISESLTPVCEIRGDDECCVWGGEV